MSSIFFFLVWWYVLQFLRGKCYLFQKENMCSSKLKDGKFINSLIQYKILKRNIEYNQYVATFFCQISAIEMTFHI